MSDICIGFDGFVDHLYHAVQKRMDRKAYIPFATLKEFGQKIEKTSLKSCNIESVLLHSHLGGNAPLITLGLSSFSYSLSLIGCLGYPALHPLFAPLEKSSVSLYSLGDPGTTLAYEFQDGKLLLGTMNDVMNLTFQEILHRFPHLQKLLHESPFWVTVNWTMSPLVQEFWSMLVTQPKEMLRGHRLFIDFADPAKRPQEDLVKALEILSLLSTRIDCFISMNLAEAEALLKALERPIPLSLHDKITALSEMLPSISLYIHTSHEVIGKDQLQITQLAVPYTEKPLRLTGAGDMFNAGLIAALHAKMPLKQQLIRALATSGIWVRKGSPATEQEVERFESLYQNSFQTINSEFSF